MQVSTDKKILRCAVLGAGRIAWHFHLPQICTKDGFELVAVVDPDEKRLDEAVRTFHPSAVFTDAEAMFEAVRPDLTVIASPTVFHKEQALLAFRSGSDVFCDKPVAMSYEDAVIMFREARRLGRKIMAYQPHRINAEGIAARAIITSEKLGKIYLIERHISNYARRNDWQAFTQNGGGMLLNYGSHYIDQLLYLTHDTTAHVKCELRSIITCGNADDVVKALITTRHGLLFDLDINQAVACPLPEWRICGSLGTAIYQNGTWNIRYCEPNAMPHVAVNRTLAAPGRRYPSESIPWREERMSAPASDPGLYYDYCHAYFAEDQLPFVLPEETLETIRTIELCRQDTRELLYS